MANPLKFGYLIPTREAVMHSVGGRADIRRMLDLAVRAERIGFDSVWIGDSILARPRFEALTTLAAIAMRTERVQIGTAIYLTPLRHPVPLAQTVCNLDLLCGGRLLFGIGLGPPTDAVRVEYAACGVDFHRRGQLQEEGLQIMKGLWSGQLFTFHGEYFRIENALLHPLPTQAGGPPVLLAAAAERPLQRAARFGDGWLPIGPNPQELSRRWELLTRYSADAGRDPAKLLRVLYVTLNINRDAAQAQQEMDAFLHDYYGGSHEQLSRTQANYAGEPRACAEFLQGFVEIGINHFIVRFASGGQETQMDRLLQEMVPLLKS